MAQSLLATTRSAQTTSGPRIRRMWRSLLFRMWTEKQSQSRHLSPVAEAEKPNLFKAPRSRFSGGRLDQEIFGRRLKPIHAYYPVIMDSTPTTFCRTLEGNRASVPDFPDINGGLCRKKHTPELTPNLDTLGCNRALCVREALR